MARRRDRRSIKARYGYDGPSRRRRVRRVVNVLRLALGGATALVGGAFLAQTINALPSGSATSRTVLWMVVTAIAVIAVVLVVSAVGWMLEYYFATHPPARADEAEDPDAQGAATPAPAPRDTT